MSLLLRLLGLGVLLVAVTAEQEYDESYDEMTERYSELSTYPDYATMEATTQGTTEPPKNKCYQCSYSPGKTIYIQREYARKIHNPKTGKYKIVRTKKMVPEKTVGGWDKCGGSFSQENAVTYGMDTWDCNYNCFVRVNKAGFLFRGCYRGEFGVDPSNTEDIQQVGDSQYKFCAGGLCNNFHMDHL